MSTILPITLINHSPSCLTSMPHFAPSNPESPVCTPISYEARLAKRQLQKIERSSSDRLLVSLARAKVRSLTQSSHTNPIAHTAGWLFSKSKKILEYYQFHLHKSPLIPPLS